MSFDGRYIDCTFCGLFKLSRSADYSYFKNEDRVSINVRATLSWLVRSHNAENTFIITTSVVESIDSGAIRRPSREMQVLNLVRWIGDRIEQSGSTISAFPVNLSAIIGAISPAIAQSMVEECIESGLVRKTVKNINPGSRFVYHDLSSKGWQTYELSRKGSSPGNYGFLALKFNDIDLDRFVNEVVKPATLELGYGIFDMRDLSQAGLIDNLMRSKIRDSAFVVADLTHDNLGAYWEAGFAEGVGKPVIYLCNRSRFQQFKTHFDVNHYTTLLWDEADPQGFTLQYIATLKRSLGLQ